MAELIPLYSKAGEVLEPVTLGECITMENGESLDSLMSSKQVFSPTIEVDSAMSKVGVGNEIDVHNNVKDGAYEECVLEGRTKWIDNDTGDILDEFATDRGLSLIDVKMPTLRNTNGTSELLEDGTPNHMHKSNTLQPKEEIVLREVNGVKDTYNALTGEYVQRIGERVYEQGDELNSLVKTDMVNTQYRLAEPITTIVKPSTVPFAYENGHVILESGYEGQSLLPHLKYSVTTSRTGQITQNSKTIMKHEQQISSLEDLLLTQIVEMDYERVLLQFDYQLQMMNLG